VYQQAIAPSRLHYLVGAFADGARVCLSVVHAAAPGGGSSTSGSGSGSGSGSSASASSSSSTSAEGTASGYYLSRYRAYIGSVVRSVVINPLCR
jgi:hypothetical protein